MRSGVILADYRISLTSCCTLAWLFVCASCTDNSEPGLPLDLETTLVYAPETSPVFVGNHLEIRIDGVIPVNVPCYDFSGVATPKGDTIAVTVVASVQKGVICQQVPSFYSFTARIGRVPAGSHTVVLRYRYQGGPPEFERIVATKLVSVP